MRSWIPTVSLATLILLGSRGCKDERVSLGNLGGEPLSGGEPGTSTPGHDGGGRGGESGGSQTSGGNSDAAGGYHDGGVANAGQSAGGATTDGGRHDAEGATNGGDANSGGDGAATNGGDADSGAGGAATTGGIPNGGGGLLGSGGGSASGGSAGKAGDGGTTGGEATGGSGATACRYVEQQRLIADDGMDGDSFGSAVAMSGDSVIIGAPNRGIAGAAYVFFRDGDRWRQQGSALVPAMGSYATGAKVALAGDIALIGGIRTAFVFVRTNGVWSEEGTGLVPADEGVRFSNTLAVGVWGDTAIVGVPETTVGENQQQGAAYVFVRRSNTWTQQGPGLVASDGFPGQRLGSSVAISKDTAFVGSNRGAYVFVRSEENWTQEGEALVPDAHATGVALDGETALIGAGGVYPNTGRVDTFIRSGTAWLETGPTLLSSQIRPGNGFGMSLALSGKVAIIGDSSLDVGTNQWQGAALIFTRTAAAWTALGEPLIDVDGAPQDFFGMAVATSGDTVMIGTGWKAVGANTKQGAVWAFGPSDCGTPP